MGIVTSLQLSKGKERAWTLDGLPTEVDVTMEIKDLYSMFVTTSIDNPGAFVKQYIFGILHSKLLWYQYQRDRLCYDAGCILYASGTSTETCCK